MESQFPRFAFPSPLVSLLITVFALRGRAAEVDVHKLPPPAESYDFARDIKPLLEEQCVGCHGETKQKGKLRLDTREGLMRGGEDGKVIVEGKSAESGLIHDVARLVEDLEMPPKKENALNVQQIGMLRAWIDAGAPWPAGLQLTATRNPAAGPDAAALAKLPPPTDRKIDFVHDIQPIFQTACYECHGPKKQEAEFRLDHKPTVLKGGELGPALVPGKSAESLLVQFVAGLREEGVMPKKGPRLSTEQISLLRAWIDQGADFPDAASVVLKDNRQHWAFHPPVKPPLPAVQDTAWPTGDIDRFILSRLEKEGLRPAAPADKAALLRRLSLDLIGLPSTIEELDAYLNDHSPDAYQKQVERLLASPHYGEKWGRHWLDAARYADSDGFEKDKPRFTYFYRDWVIDALNRDLPYNQFIIEQIAGDQLPNATQDQIVATGFLRNSMINEEGGVDPEQFRMEAMFDRMDCIGKSILGLTIQCCQCHTHKYDPITQEEYYRLFSFLNNDAESQPTVYTADALMKRAELLRQIGTLEQKLQQETPDWKERMLKWEESAKARPQPEWRVVQAPFEDISTGGQKYLLQKDGSYLAQGYAPTKHSAKVTVKTDLQGVRAFRLELLNDPNLPANGPGRSLKGTCALTEFEVSAAPAATPDKPGKIKLVKATADYGDAPDTPLEANFEDKSGKKRVTGPISYAIDGNDDTAWGTDAGPGRRNQPHEAVFVAENPIGNEGETLLTFTLKQNHGGWNSDDLQTNNLGRFRLSITSSADAEAEPVPARVRELFAIPADKRSATQLAAEFSYWRTIVPEWKDANSQIDALWKQFPEGTTQLALSQRDNLRDTHLLKRGDWLKPGKPVIAGVPGILNPLTGDAPPTRLTLARWLVAPDSPTTARAFVNRVWQHYFGIGIVSTSEDLGTQCDPPSHPELLDWLACEFMEKGWSMKSLHRLIVNSSTYRQSSNITPELYARDPYNRLLARGPRFRVDGEIVRDIALASSGLLNPVLGGRSVMPPAPDFLFKPPASYAPFPWVEETGPERYRRAVYTYRRRSTPYPMLQAFDTPEGNVSCVRRTRSNTPLQALTTLNETLSIEAARALARQILTKGGATDRERLTYAFRCCLSRPPSDAETSELVTLMAKQRARIADGWLDPWELATGKKERPEVPPNVTPTQLAEYTVISRVLLNLDETITKE